MVYFSCNDYRYPMGKDGKPLQSPMRTRRGAPIPYFMAFPMNDGWETEEENQRDFELMKRMYPEKMRRIMNTIDEECDKLEYEGSMMFDEHPDRLMLSQLCGRICDKVRDVVNMEEVYEAMQRRPDRPERPSHGNQGDWLSDIVQVLLFDEMHRRRCRHRNGRCRRW